MDSSNKFIYDPYGFVVCLLRIAQHGNQKLHTSIPHSYFTNIRNRIANEIIKQNTSSAIHRTCCGRWHGWARTGQEPQPASASSAAPREGGGPRLRKRASLAHPRPTLHVVSRPGRVGCRGGGRRDDLLGQEMGPGPWVLHGLHVGGVAAGAGEGGELAAKYTVRSTTLVGSLHSPTLQWVKTIRRIPPNAKIYSEYIYILVECPCVATGYQFFCVTQMIVCH
jgi:hypothetical protein